MLGGETLRYGALECLSLILGWSRRAFVDEIQRILVSHTLCAASRRVCVLTNHHCRSEKSLGFDVLKQKKQKVDLLFSGPGLNLLA